MISKLNSLFCYIKNRRWTYICSRSNVRSLGHAQINIASSAAIHSSSIVVTKGSTLKIAEGTIIDHCNIYVNGYLEIGRSSQIGSADQLTLITIDDGKVIINHHSKISCSRVWVRFGGQLTIGYYTNLNAMSEVRCDDHVSIGDYCMISYNVSIWDTNTHCLYPSDKRRQITERYWPYFGKEIEKPLTAPVVIGNDVWIGKNGAILKGSIIKDACIIGYATIIAGKELKEGTKVVNKSIIRYL